ncbi:MULTISPECIES: sensor histidine kinase [unclassified Leifsonia]|uniref:sensor histidine kinase n=1 Tax=unclassified Leifsonia TaxID=2663824 RepID=UPI0006FE81AA|nr:MULTISPECIES: HAMP domain-containing sensor histidine kinase [unclassified Leifsonia]KQX07713.1 hypothetical protein ASC59_08255 [Leifsonia sp. Root1293]KRA11995.1 hypothetical protein ASD61_08255 [Leifsonia sp. Root60]
MIKNIGIRTRIAGGSLLIAILISIAAGIVINTQIERIVREGTTAVLRSDSEPYVVALENEPTESFDPPGPSQLVAVVSPNGATPVDSLPANLSAMVPTLTTLDKTTTVTAGGTDYIVLATPVQVSDSTWTVIAARDADAETTILTQMRLLLVFGLALISLGTALAAWLLTSFSLGPVNRLRASAETLSDSSTTELLPVSEANDEISRLARTLNDLIERLRASAARERQLVSDASHELRTPLALLNTQLQVAVAEASSIDQLLADVQGAQRNVMRLSTLVTSLLELSEIEATGHDGRTTAIALSREVAEAVDRGRFRATDAAIEVTYSPLNDSDADGQQFAIHAEDFGRVVDNLINNSLRAIETNGRIDIALLWQDPDLVLTVTDTGGGLDPAFEPTAFDRFSRADRSRGSGGGSGLGLAIVAAVAHNAGGTIRLDNRPSEGLTVVVTLRQTDIR